VVVSVNTSRAVAVVAVDPDQHVADQDIERERPALRRVGGDRGIGAL
jgi:hypothetical protein